MTSRNTTLPLAQTWPPRLGRLALGAIFLPSGLGKVQMVNFLKNVSIGGGLPHLFATPAWQHN